MRAVILAAGKGTRLGAIGPKCLTELERGVSILDLQVNHLIHEGVDEITVVVGYNKDLIIRRYPKLQYICNEVYDKTNTAYSLLLGLTEEMNEDVLWINGDVVCPDLVFQRLMRGRKSGMATIKGMADEEAVQYRLDQRGRIGCVGKQLEDGAGEAVGVNYVIAKELHLLKAGLKKCERNDYFEQGVEHAIGEGMEIYAVDVSDLPCIEIDYPQDLEKARTMFHVCASRGAWPNEEVETDAGGRRM